MSTNNNSSTTHSVTNSRSSSMRNTIATHCMISKKLLEMYTELLHKPLTNINLYEDICHLTNADIEILKKKLKIYGPDYFKEQLGINIRDLEDKQNISIRKKREVESFFNVYMRGEENSFSKNVEKLVGFICYCIIRT